MLHQTVSAKTKQLVGYLVSKHSLSTVTSLIKLCYLCDLVSVDKGDGKITDFNYIRWHFGPYDRRIEDVLNELVKDGAVVSETAYTDHGTEYIKYTAKDDDPTTSGLTDKDFSHIDAVLESLKGFGPKALTQVAYKTKPMQALGATLGGTQNMGATLNLSQK